MAKLAREAGFQQVDRPRDRRQARRLRDARRRRGEDRRALLHVRRQAVRSRRVDLAAARGADRRQARARQGDGGPRRGQPEGPAGGVPRRAARDSRRRPEAARSTSCWSPRARRRSARRTSARSCAGPRWRRRFATCIGVFMPAPAQDPDGNVTVSLGAKGVVELELVSSGEKWGRGPPKDVHSSLKAMVDSPAWHLVKALDTLVSADGNTITIDGYPQPRPLSAEEHAMIAAAAKRRNEAKAKKRLGVQHWIDDLPWQRGERAARVAADGEHRGAGRRLHRAGRQDDPAAPRGGQDRPAPGARHEEGRRRRRAQGASREARLRRHRGERDRRLRPDEHPGDRAADPGADRGATSAPASIRCSGRATPAPTPATSSPASRSSSPPATSASATAAARTRRTSTT